MRALRSKLFGILLCVLALAHTVAAQSIEDRATAHLNAGKSAFESGNYAQAIEELNAGYVLAPQARFQYALGQAYRMNHQCTDAVRMFRTFLLSKPAHGQAEAAELNIKRCGDEDPASLRDDQAPPPQPATVAQRAPDLIVQSAPPPRTPVYKKWWLWTTVSGVVAVGIGLGVGLGLGLNPSRATFPAPLGNIGPGANKLALRR